jgi:hypothetical protein
LISLQPFRLHILPSLRSHPLEEACLWHRIKICPQEGPQPAHPRLSRMKCTSGSKFCGWIPEFQHVINVTSATCTRVP